MRSWSDLWPGILGVHGFDLAGEEFLDYCTKNQLTIIMNTWFMKRGIHLGTWKHPATKRPGFT